MAYKHGVQTSEVATSVLPSAESAAGIPFIVGTAPVNMTNPANVNKPVLCYNYAEAVEAFGFVPAKLDEDSGLKKFEYTLSELIYSQFSLFNVGPVILVNVLDPTKHKKAATTTAVTLDTKTGAVTVAETGILPDSVAISAPAGAAYTKGTDFITAFDDDGNLVITSLKGEDDAFLCAVGEALEFTAQVLDPSAVTADDIVGGVDVNGKKSGLELIGEVFPRFRLVPGIIAAPGFSQSPTVAAVMAAKAAVFNGCFEAVAYVDIPTDEVKRYSEAADWKNSNNVADARQAAFWPMVALDGTAFHMSTQAVGLTNKTDSENDGMPHVSPSNKKLQATAAVLADGEEVWLDKETAEYINGQGVITALNFVGGWKLWGNRTAVYPASTDPKDAFLCARRMFGFARNQFVLSNWQHVDMPILPRNIDRIVDSENYKYDGWTKAGYLLGGKIEFREEDNVKTDVMDGKLKFRIKITPPSPARDITGVFEYDVSNFSKLFE